MYTFSAISLKRLQGVNPNLVKVVKRALEVSEVDFGVAEGVRTYKRQKELYAQGKTKTLNSKHITGNAVDLFAYKNGKVYWDFNSLRKVAQAMFIASSELNTPIKAGILFKNSWDSPHFELIEARRG
jgi:hypothetical protein